MLVICNGMYRSGSTLQYNICRSLVEKLDIGKGEGFFEGNQLFNSQDQFLEWSKDPLFHVIKIHNFSPKAVEMSLNGSVKICYIYRDIRDVAASLKNKDKVNDQALITTLDAAIETYHKIKHVPNVLIQKYETVVIDIHQAIKQLVVFLGLKASEDEIEWVKKECSVENVKKVMSSLVASDQDTQPHTSLQYLYDSKTLLHHNHISNNSGFSSVWRVDLEQAEINLITDRYKSWLIEVKYLLDINLSNLNHHKQGGSGMRVEACCQRILSYALPLVDENRDGICIDVGVGTFAFYCEMFSMLGFKTIAVEPLPVEGVRVLCQYDGITLIEACLSDVTGTQTIHLGNVAAGWDSNYASLEPDWFGVSTETREVQSLTLSKLLLNLNAQKVTCLKLDIEGAESTVISKFGELPKAWLPNVVMFEYGGGDYKEKGQYGWSPKFIKATMECLTALKDCGYGFCIMIDNALNTEAKIFDLQSLILEPDSIFYHNGGYGNIIAFRDFNLPEEVLTKLCAPYYETSDISQNLVTDTNIVISETEELEVCQFRLSQIQQELEQQKAVLEQSQSQLHQTQGELEQSQSQLQSTQGELAQSQSQLHQTQGELAQSQSQLHQTQGELAQSQSQLHQTQGELEQSQSQLQSTQGELAQSQSQLHQTQGELAQSQSQLHQTQGELEQYSEHLAQTAKILEQYQFHLQQTQRKLEQSQSQLYQTQGELTKEKSQTDQIKSKLHQTHVDLEELTSKLSLRQAELVRIQFQQQYIITESQLENDAQYKLLVWDAWYAYRNGDLKKMQQCLQNSLKFTPVSRTESLLKWLESFCQFSAENGQPFDTYALTNSEEWKRLMLQQRVIVSKG